MNYLKSIENWSDEKWRGFGLEFLQHTGWDRDWSSDFDVLSVDGKRFLASFRNNMKQGAVGISIEKDVLSRLKRASAEGFIGFYSGDYATSLDTRLRSLNIPVFLVSGVQISVLLPYFDSSFIDSHFGRKEKNSLSIWSHYVNKIDPIKYRPLYCMCGCGADILRNASSIAFSAAFIHRAEDKLYFIYGLKNCIFSACDDNTSCGWIEINQILHPDQFNIWNGMLNDYVAVNTGLDLEEYYGPKRIFLARILQRIRPVNAGFFMGAEEF